MLSFLSDNKTLTLQVAVGLKNDSILQMFLTDNTFV